MPVTKRRTISLDAFVEQNINNLRAMALTKNFEIDFTSMINAFAEYGIRKSRNGSADPLFIEILGKYLQYSDLQESAILDSWTDMQSRKSISIGKTNKQKEKSVVIKNEPNVKTKAKYIT